jgi:hypothetical protein
MKDQETKTLIEFLTKLLQAFLNAPEEYTNQSALGIGKRNGKF